MTHTTRTQNDHDTHFLRKLSAQVRGVWQEIGADTFRRGCIKYTLGHWRPIAYAKTGPILWVGERQPTIREAVHALISWWRYRDEEDPLIPDAEDEESLDEEEPPCPIMGTDEFFARST